MKKAWSTILLIFSIFKQIFFFCKGHKMHHSFSLFSLCLFWSPSPNEPASVKPKKVAEPEGGDQDGVDQEGQKKARDKKTQKAEKGWKVVQRRVGTGEVSLKWRFAPLTIGTKLTLCVCVCVCVCVFVC